MGWSAKPTGTAFLTRLWVSIRYPLHLSPVFLFCTMPHSTCFSLRSNGLLVVFSLLLMGALTACQPTPEQAKQPISKEEAETQQVAQEVLQDSLDQPEALADSVLAEANPEDAELEELETLLGDPEEWLEEEEETIQVELPEDGSYLKNPVADAEPGPTDLVRVDEDAEPLNLDKLKASLNKYHAKYQPQAQGTVRLKVLVDERGVYRKHQVNQAAPTDTLQQLVEQAVKRLRYRPASYKNAPRKVWVNFEHTFTKASAKEKNRGGSNMGG